MKVFKKTFSLILKKAPLLPPPIHQVYLKPKPLLGTSDSVFKF